MLCPTSAARKRLGFTLIETTVAIGLVGMFIAVLIVMSSNMLGLLRSSKDNVAASQTLQERMENVRKLTWAQLCKATDIKDRAMAANAVSAHGLTQCIETVTVTAYPHKADEAPIKVVRKNGVTTVASDNPGMLDERMAKVEISLVWRGFPSNRQHERVTATLISRVGSTK
jgi:type II secretory pathway pseudopilin PulG